MPSKSTPFTPSSILFRPRRQTAPPEAAFAAPLGLWWRRRVLPPGPIGLLRRPFIAIAGLRRHHEYKRGRLTEKRGLGGPPHNPPPAAPRSPRVRRGQRRSRHARPRLCVRRRRSEAARGNSHHAGISFGSGAGRRLKTLPCPRRSPRLRPHLRQFLPAAPTLLELGRRLRPHRAVRLRRGPGLVAAHAGRGAPLDDPRGVQRRLRAVPVPARPQRRQPLGRIRPAHPRRGRVGGRAAGICWGRHS